MTISQNQNWIDIVAQALTQLLLPVHEAAAETTDTTPTIDAPHATGVAGTDDAQPAEHCDPHTRVELDGQHHLSHHAWQRMCQYGLSPQHVLMGLTHGRIVHTRNAAIYVIGKKEIERDRQHRRAMSRLNGLRIVTSENGTIMTITVNPNLRNLPKKYNHNKIDMRQSEKQKAWACVCPYSPYVAS